MNTTSVALVSAFLLLVVGPSCPAAGRSVAVAAEDGPPSMTLRDLDGAGKSLDDWAGRTRLVNFWATWCGPCRAEIPLLEDSYHRYGRRNFSIIGVALDTTAAVSRFKSRFGITYPLLIAGTGTGIDMMKEYGNASGGVPYSVLLSPGGEVLETHLGQFDEDELRELLERHLEREPQTQFTRAAHDRPPAIVKTAS